jgi:uncharacterized protein (TIGR02444 family)
MDTLWRFSLAVYRQPGVAAECLALQDDYGVDVNLLLFAAYAGAIHGVVLEPAEIAAAGTLVGAWHDEVVRPLRATRRALKPREAGEAAVKALRAQVKAAELEAERLEQVMLSQWAASRLEAWPRRDPHNAVTQNVRALLPLAAPMPQRLVAEALAQSRISR